MRRYMWCLLGAIGMLVITGMVMLYASTAYAYEAAEFDRSTQDLSGEIASLESVYKEQTAYFNQESFSNTKMVRYSPRGETVRYARVGGSVYSMLSSSSL